MASYALQTPPQMAQASRLGQFLLQKLIFIASFWSRTKPQNILHFFSDTTNLGEIKMHEILDLILQGLRVAQAAVTERWPSRKIVRK